MNHSNHTIPCDCSTCINKSDNYKHEPPEKPLICGEQTTSHGVVEGRNLENKHLVSQFSSIAQPLPRVSIAASCLNNAAYQQVFLSNIYSSFYLNIDSSLSYYSLVILKHLTSFMLPISYKSENLSVLNILESIKV